jgi:hypothetical protein
MIPKAVLQLATGDRNIIRIVTRLLAIVSIYLPRPQL